MNRKFPRSLLPKTKRTADAPCSFKPHCKGVVREVIGYLENLLARFPDEERFVWFEVETLRLNCRRYHEDEHGKPDKKGKLYERRAILYALKYLRRKYIISSRLKRTRHGVVREGVILTPHDALFSHTGKLCEYVGRKVPKTHWLRDAETRSWHWIPDFPSQAARLVSDAARLEEKIKSDASVKKAGLQVSEKTRLARLSVTDFLAAALPPAKPKESMTYETAAKRAGVPAKAVRQFRNIEKNAPEVADMVRAGLKPTDGAKLAALPIPLREIAIKAVKSGVEVRAAVRAAKKQNYNDAIATTKPKELEGTYRVLYADPPWKYVGLNQADEYGHAERHYDCLDDEQLKKYKIGARLIKDMMDKNAVLFLWVTSPLLERCFSVIEAWGFE